MRRITRPLLILLAIIFLIEAWLWRHLEPIVETVVGWIPLRAVKARIARPDPETPAGRDADRVSPCRLAVLFPLKLLGLWLLAHKYWFAAGVILVLAKLVGLGVTAFVFEATKPKLLQMAWFRWLYEHVLVWLDWAHELVAPIKDRIGRLLRLFRSEQSGRCAAIAVAHPPPDEQRAQGGRTCAQCRCNRCGATNPSAMKAIPITPRPTER